MMGGQGENPGHSRAWDDLRGDKRGREPRHWANKNRKEVKRG